MSFLTSRQTDEQAAAQRQLFLNAYNQEASKDSAEARAEALRQKALIDYLYKEKLAETNRDTKLAVAEVQSKSRADEIALKSGNKFLQDTLERNRTRYGFMLKNTQSHLQSIVKDPNVSDEYKRAVNDSINDIIVGTNAYEKGVTDAWDSEPDPAKKLAAALRIQPKFPEIGIDLEQYNDPLADQMNQAKIANLEANLGLIKARTAMAQKKMSRAGRGGGGGASAMGNPDRDFSEQFGTLQKTYQAYEEIDTQLAAQLAKERNPRFIERNPHAGSDAYKKLLDAKTKMTAVLRGALGGFVSKIQDSKHTPAQVKEMATRMMMEVDDKDSVDPILEFDWFGDNPISNYAFGGRQKEIRNEFRSTYNTDIDFDRKKSPMFQSPDATTNSFGISTPFLTPPLK